MFFLSSIIGTTLIKTKSNIVYDVFILNKYEMYSWTDLTIVYCTIYLLATFLLQCGESNTCTYPATDNINHSQYFILLHVLRQLEIYSIKVQYFSHVFNMECSYKFLFSTYLTKT